MMKTRNKPKTTLATVVVDCMNSSYIVLVSTCWATYV